MDSEVSTPKPVLASTSDQESTNDGLGLKTTNNSEIKKVTATTEGGEILNPQSKKKARRLQKKKDRKAKQELHGYLTTCLEKISSLPKSNLESVLNSLSINTLDSLASTSGPTPKQIPETQMPNKCKICAKSNQIARNIPDYPKPNAIVKDDQQAQSKFNRGQFTASTFKPECQCLEQMNNLQAENPPSGSKSMGASSSFGSSKTNKVQDTHSIDGANLESSKVMQMRSRLQIEESIEILRNTVDNKKELLKSMKGKRNSKDKGNENPTLQKSTEAGIYDLVLLLTSCDVNIEYRGNIGYTPLHLASFRGHTRIVELLLSLGADIEAKSSTTKDTPLLLACCSGSEDVVELLLSQGANARQMNIYFYSPMSMAAGYGHRNIIRLLLGHGIDVDEKEEEQLITPLMMAVANGKIATVKFLLDRGADVNVQTKEHGVTALSFACRSKNLQIVNCLLERNANVNHIAKSGVTALMHTAFTGYTPIVKSLLDKGADINARDPDHAFNVLTILVTLRHVDCVKTLLSRKVAVDFKNNKGETALRIACALPETLPMIKALYEYGADINAVDKEGTSCLMAALTNGHLDNLSWILKHVKKIPSNAQIKGHLKPEQMNDCKIKKCVELIFEAKEASAKLLQSERNAAKLLKELEREESQQKSKQQNKREKKKMSQKMQQSTDSKEDTEKVIQKDCSVIEKVSNAKETLQKMSPGEEKDLERDSQYYSSSAGTDDYAHSSEVPEGWEKVNRKSTPNKEEFSSQVIPGLPRKGRSDLSKSRDSALTEEKLRKFHGRNDGANKSARSTEMTKTTQLPEKKKTTQFPEKKKTTQFPEKKKATQFPEKNKVIQLPEKKKATQFPEKKKVTQLPEKKKVTQLPEKKKVTQFPEKKKATQLPKSSLQNPPLKKTIEYFPVNCANKKNVQISKSASIQHQNSTYPLASSSTSTVLTSSGPPTVVAPPRNVFHSNDHGRGIYPIHSEPIPAPYWTEDTRCLEPFGLSYSQARNANSGLRPIGWERRNELRRTPVNSLDGNSNSENLNRTDFDVTEFLNSLSLSDQQLNATPLASTSSTGTFSPFLGMRFYEEAYRNDQIQMELLQEMGLRPIASNYGPGSCSRLTSYGFAQSQETDSPTNTTGFGFPCND